jgi:2,3-bisphosphoglycerate-independent phosphoglycerate mutase
MKYIIILGDGMSDRPENEHGGLTPLMAAHKPSIDKLAELGRSGLLKTIPEKLHPGSEVANLAVLGYDVEAIFEGRGVIEAASMGVKLGEGDLALRCNLICVSDEKIKNHSAGHISTVEAKVLINYLNEELGSETIKFYPGVSYRHLLVIRGGSKALHCVPPHDVMGTPVIEVIPSATDHSANITAQLLVDLIQKSRKLLISHPVNIRRKMEGKDMANSIWPWSPGYKPAMKSLNEMYGIKRGAVISAVDLIQGIGVLAGLDVIKVEGATGLYDTNYEGKAEAALEALKTHDFVYLHIEASDEAGHEGDYDLKLKTIEYLDHRVVRYLVEEIPKLDEPVVIAILPDHPTPWKLKTHTRDAVPFLIWYPGIEPDDVIRYDEISALNGSFGILENGQFMQELLKNDNN